MPSNKEQPRQAERAKPAQHDTGGVSQENVHKLPPKAPETPKPAQRPVDGAGDDSQGGPPPKRDEPKRPKFPFYVAKGKSVTTSRGIIDALQEIRPTDFVHSKRDADKGQERLDALVKAGVVVDNRSPSKQR